MAIYNLTVNSSNACGAGATSTVPGLSVGALTVFGVCPNPLKVSGLSVTSGQVGVAFNSTFNISSCTGGAALGLPLGLNFAGINSSTGVGTITGVPSQTGSFPITFAAVNVCGGGDTTSQTPSIPLGTITIAAAGSTIAPSGANTFEASGSFVSQAGIVGVQFRSNGTTVLVGNSQTGSTPNWFGTATAGVGNNYWVRATATVVVAGYGSLAGSPVNTWVPLSSEPFFAVSNSNDYLSTALVYDYTFEFSSNAAGTNIVATHTSCTMSLTNEATNG